jgi:P27 family predicted phage terminase small subunit
MGKRGPAPTPTALLALSGTHRAKKRLEQGEPQPSADLPVDAPEWLRDRAVDFWTNIVPILVDMGVMTGADCEALAMYCQTLAKLEEYETFIATNGSTYTTHNALGEPLHRVRPEATMAKDMTALASKLGQQFGLTPSSRAHLVVNDPSKNLKTDKNQFFRATKTA